jgi:plastocyanin
MKKIAAIIVVSLVLLGAGGFALYAGSSKPSTKSPGQTTSATTQQPADSQAGTVIAYTDNGFEPKNLTVKVGSTLTVKNNSSMDLQFSSDKHPVHTDNPELNEPVIGPGKQQTVSINHKGTWGVHNHLQASDTATLIVE